ncbi:hypothetical protein HHI36_014348 [Cryptolaemus montrouzieri]|uniref:Uncharacterized protein n=1 Tax=Cryptolaemus montrouzieri TaxID=559131 RepID=A0ABD2N2R6_9CUCU
MNNFLKCRLTYLLDGLNYQDAINSFDDITYNQIKIGLAPSMIPLINTTPGISEYIEKFYIQCDVGPDCLRRSAFQKDIAVFKPARKAREFIKSYMIESRGEILLKEIKPAFVVEYQVIHFQRGHPLFPTFNKYLSNLIDTGMVGKIISKYDPKIETMKEIYEGPKALKTEHLVIPLVIWIAGIVCASIMFASEKILENTTHLIRRRK